MTPAVILAAKRHRTMQQESDNSPQSASPATQHGGASWGVCLSFWCCLLVAVALYGSVALAPKLTRWIHVRNQYATNAVRIAELDAHVEYLERVTHTLQTDPDFTRRLAAANDQSGIGSDVLPVSKSLIFGNGEQVVPSPQPIPLPPGATLLNRLATDRTLRVLCLSVAITLVVFSFTFLNDSDTSWLWVVPSTCLVLAQTLFRRYQRELPAAAAAEATPELPSNSEQADHVGDD